MFPSMRVWRRQIVGCTAALFAAAGALLLPSCTGGNDPRTHPVYVLGLKLEESGDHEAAMAAFRKCLRMAPGHRLAHVHLGKLYEDAGGDPLAAMYHYARGSDGGGGGAHAQFARAALERLRRQYAAQFAPVPEVPNHESELVVLRQRVAELEAASERLAGERDALATRLADVQGQLAAVKLQLAEAKLAVPEEGAQPASGTGEIRVEKIHTVEKGDTLYGLAREHYGDPRKWRKLRDYNQAVLQGSDILKPGMKIRIPDERTLERSGSGNQ
jgi:hypothetical protein